MTQTLSFLDLRPLLENGGWRELLSALPPQRRTRALSCRREMDAARIAGAGFLLRQMLLRAGVPAAGQIFRENAWGKPYLPDGPEFSLSHAGHFAVCAVGPAPLGVDIEQPRITMQVAARCFHPDEVDFLKALPPQAQPAALARLWTAKEAYTKYLGQGLTLPLSSFRVRLSKDSAVLELPDAGLPPILHEYVLEDYRLCLCSELPRPKLTCVCL